jgi:hypothetical protein
LALVGWLSNIPAVNTVMVASNAVRTAYSNPQQAALLWPHDTSGPQPAWPVLGPSIAFQTSPEQPFTSCARGTVARGTEAQAPLAAPLWARDAAKHQQEQQQFNA